MTDPVDRPAPNLVARLRARFNVLCKRGQGECVEADLLREAADHIASLETQLRSVAQERDALKADHAALERGIAYRSVVEEAGRQFTRAEQAEAALARLRGALQQIAALGDGESFEELFDQALGLAKAALADAPTAPLAWLARLNDLGTHPEVRAARAAECVLLGHEPSGEFHPTGTPQHFCYWCAGKFLLGETNR